MRSAGSIIDERADERQREALIRTPIVASGLDTIEGATFFQVFSTTYAEKVHDPVFAPIELDIDIDGRTARLVIERPRPRRCIGPAMVDARAFESRSAMQSTGEETRAQTRADAFRTASNLTLRRWGGDGRGRKAPSGSNCPTATPISQNALHMTESGVVH